MIDISSLTVPEDTFQKKVFYVGARAFTHIQAEVVIVVFCIVVNLL